MLYSFPNRGDGIPMHAHAHPALEHSVRCILGRVAVYSLGRTWARELAPGDELVFDSSRPHEICALEDGSCVLNVFAHGRPDGYDKLPPHELDRDVEFPPLTERL